MRFFQDLKRIKFSLKAKKEMRPASPFLNGKIGKKCLCGAHRLTRHTAVYTERMTYTAPFPAEKQATPAAHVTHRGKPLVALYHRILMLESGIRQKDFRKLKII